MLSVRHELLRVFSEELRHVIDLAKVDDVDVWRVRAAVFAELANAADNITCNAWRGDASRRANILAMCDALVTELCDWDEYNPYQFEPSKREACALAAYHSHAAMNEYMLEHGELPTVNEHGEKFANFDELATYVTVCWVHDICRNLLYRTTADIETIVENVRTRMGV